MKTFSVIATNMPVKCNQHTKHAKPMGGTQSCGGHTHISFYVGVTLQSFVLQSPGAGPLKTPDPGLASEGCQSGMGCTDTAW